MARKVIFERVEVFTTLNIYTLIYRKYSEEVSTLFQKVRAYLSVQTQKDTLTR
jgi:hypothetical protein